MKTEMQAFAEELLLMRDYDLQVRDELQMLDELNQGYHPRMEMVHQQNALRMETLVETLGWPDANSVGAEANEAALLIVLHAISMPGFQRNMLAVIKAAVEGGLEEGVHYAYLYDRICYNERRPQLFGTQFDWDETGQMSPWLLERPELVEQLRSEFGLPPLSEHLQMIRESVEESGEQAPADFTLRQQEIEEWCRKTGWIQ